MTAKARRLHGLCVLSVLASLVATPAARQPSAVFDVVVANGRVIDPESGLDAVRHVGISGGSIAAVSANPLRGRTVIEAKDLVVAPGFIDLHQHGHTPDAYLLKAADGVTSAFELEVGVGDIDSWYAERAGKSAINYGASSGHIPVRMTVLNDAGDFLPSGPAAQREATDAELQQIVAGVGRGLDRGAPAFVHMRGGDPLAATQEVIASAVATGTPLHIVHVQSTGGRQTAAVLRLIAMARDRGVDVTTEMYPYTASATRIESALYENWQQFPDSRFQNFLWPATGERLTRETFAKYRAVGGTVISFGNTEDVVSFAVAHPLTMIASDGSLLHPRGSGTFSRVLGRYVREQQALTLTDAIRKMTIMPARRLEKFIPAMQRKGRIAAGADADIVVFDPAQVIDRSTYEKPATASNGFRHVLVAGVAIVREGTLQDARPGRAVRAAIR